VLKPGGELDDEWLETGKRARNNAAMAGDIRGCAHFPAQLV
jgi:hypothetical protein